MHRSDTIHPRTPGLCPLVLTAAVACTGGPAGDQAGPAPGWRVDGPPGAQPALTVQDGWTTLDTPAQGHPIRVCHPLAMGGQVRARLDWPWSVVSKAGDAPVTTILATYQAADGGALRGPGGQQRLLTLRGEGAANAEQRTRALLSSPAEASAAELCLQARGLAGATLRLGEPALSSIEPAGQPTWPNLVVVVVDALRADAIGTYGAAPSPTPAIDAFAQGALVLEHAWTQYTWTGPSFVSYISSRWARSHGWVSSWADRGALRPRPGAESPTLPAVLRDAGYLCVGLNANGYLDWLDASELGFDQWSFEGDAPAVDAALRELALWPHDGRPNLLYLHLMATHHPLCPSDASQRAAGVSIDPALYGARDNKCPGGGLGQDAQDYLDQGLTEAEHLAIYQRAYAAAVRDADRHFGRVLEALQQHGLTDSTVVVFMSDHGELLGEHGHNGHGPWVWEPLARVPLLISGPGITAGRRREGVARLIDLAPTLLDSAGLLDRQPEAWQGRSLLRPHDDPALAVTERQAWVAFTVDGQHKRIADADSGELRGLYDLMADPGELRPVEPRAGDTFSDLDDVSHAWLDQTPVARPQGEQADGRLEEVLRGLGYVE